MSLVFFNQVNMKDGTKRYISAADGGTKRLRLIKSKSKATKTSRNIAEILSDYFWEHHWDYDTMESRYTDSISVRGES